MVVSEARCAPTISAFGNRRQEDQEFMVILYREFGFELHEILSQNKTNRFFFHRNYYFELGGGRGW